MLHQGLKLSGEDKTFFQRGRLADLEARLPAGFRPGKVLDFGCGLGDTTALLAELFPEAEIVGSDTSQAALEHAQQVQEDPRLSFVQLEELPADGSFDMA